MYDVIIVGGGPGGLTAGIYSARYMLKTLIISKEFGGQITEAHMVCNFPSQPNISGFELGNKMFEQVKSLGVNIKYGEVIKISKEDRFIVYTEKEKYEAKTIILAIGRRKAKLGVPGEDKFLGRGVSYCATCDAPFFKDKIVAVVGGGNSALTAALLLSEFAKKVYIIYRRSKFFRAEPAWVKAVNENQKITPIFNTNVVSINGDLKVSNIKLTNGETLDVDGVFIEIGSIPDNTLVNQLGVKTDEKGYVIVNEEKQTNVPGVYAVGDMTNGPLKQVITACADGAIAATSIYNQISQGDSNGV